MLRFSNKSQVPLFNPLNRSLCFTFFFFFPETETTIRPKSVDISQRGSTTISDFLPAPEPLFRLNHTVDLSANRIHTDDLDAQNINTPTNYYQTEDVSDLADPAVVAIHNLKTLPPSETQITYSKPAPAIEVSQITPILPQITYTAQGTKKPGSSPKVAETRF